MAYTTIDDPSAYFQTALYTGNGSSQSVVNDGNSDLQPDWLWIKERSSTSGHILKDTNRGVNNSINTHNSDQESASSSQVTSINSDGFSVGTDNGTNQSSVTMVAWQWKANGGTTSTNNDGSTASTVQANTTAGFSIVTFSRSAGGTITVGHGLGKKPDWIIVKSRQTSNNWVVTHKSLGTEMQDYYTILNGTDASSNSNDIFGGEPTSSVFSTTNNVASNDNQVAYCFTEIKGYSKFGSYTANGNVDGPFVYTGFKPAWVMFKQTNSSDTAHWFMYDSTRSPTNVIGDVGLAANLSNAEGLGSTWDPNTSDSVVDFVSNGFKIRTTATSGFNISGNTMIYMAFAEHPFVSSKGVPTTAR